MSTKIVTEARKYQINKKIMSQCKNKWYVQINMRIYTLTHHLLTKAATKKIIENIHAMKHRIVDGNTSETKHAKLRQDINDR